MLEQAPGRTCAPMESGTCAVAGSWRGTCRTSTLEKSVPDGLHPMDGIDIAAVPEVL